MRQKIIITHVALLICETQSQVTLDYVEHTHDLILRHREDQDNEIPYGMVLVSNKNDSSEPEAIARIPSIATSMKCDQNVDKAFELLCMESLKIKNRLF